MNPRIALATIAALTIAACSAPPPEAMGASSSRETDTPAVPARLLGMNLDPLNGTSNPTTADLADIGARAVRFELHAESGAEAAFDAYDQALDTYAAAGVRVLVILDQATLPRDGEWGDYVNRFAARAGQIAEHFGSRVAAYEIWNEPDLDGPIRHIDGAPYGELLNASYDAIKGVSDAKVVTAGLASGQPSYVEAMGDFRADALSTHPYLHWFGAGGPESYYQFEDHISAFAAFGLPLWFTEWGTDDPELQPRQIANVFDNITNDDRIEETFFFAWSDTNFPGMGVTTDGTSQKPAYSAFARYGRGVASSSSSQ